MDLPEQIIDLSGEEPHESHGGWRNFLINSCEVRDEHDGVVFYGATNCNYVVFPDGTLVRNYGYHGNALMNRVRDEGRDVVLAAVKKDMAEIKATVARLKQ